MEKRYTRAVLYILMLMLIMVGTLNQEVRAAGEDKAKNKTSVFNDIAANEPNIVFINYVSQRGIIKGYPDGGFHAQAGLTRAEAAAVLVKAAGLPTPPVTTSAFKDVPVSHWATAQIAAATKAGYLKGFPDGTYQPEAKVTRAQGIALVMRLCTQKERAVLPSLKDMDSQHWAAGDMATALTLEMIGLSKDSQNIYPEAEMSRGSLARALAVLLTKDPGLNAVNLEGTASEVKGQVTLIRQGKSQELNDKVAIRVGDTIKTGGNGSLRLNYPDGSSNLVEANTEINIKQAEGRRYIKEDGTPGIAVDYLNMGMPQGTMFGGVATKHAGQTEGSVVNPAAGPTNNRVSRLAARPGFSYLAAADSAQAPWYKTAEQKKVKVKVDMPWGVAAIRGTYLMITVNQDGTCKVACLTGNVDVSSNSSNQSVAVTSGQTSGITGENSAAQTAAPMSAGEKQDFGNKDVQNWIFNSALQQDVNKEAQVAPPVVQMIVEIPDNKPGEKPQQQVIETKPPAQEESKPGEKTQAEQSAQQVTTAVQTVLDAIKSSGIEIKAEAIESLKQQIQQMQNQIPQQTAEQLSQQVEQAQSQSNPATPSTTNTSTTSSSGSSIVATSYSTAGTYGSSDPAVPNTVSSIFVNAEKINLQNMEVTGNVTVNYPNTNLSNLVISGNLYLAAGIGEGNVSLQKVTVKGNTLINGGGPNSIEVTDCSLYTVEVDKDNNSIRVVAKGSSQIGALTLNSGAGLAEENLTGTGFSAISINGTDIPSTASIVLSGNFDSVTINSPNIKLEVPSGSIGELNLAASASGGNITLAAGVGVTRLLANAAGNIAGTGKIEQAEITVDGVEILQPPMVWTLSPGVKVRIDGEMVSQSGVNTRLASLGLDQGTLNPVFAPKTLSYNVLVGSNISSLALSPVTEDSQAAFTVSAANLSGTAANPVIGLTSGDNAVGIKVTGRDRSSQKDYSLTITRANSPVVSLTNPGAVSLSVYDNISVSLATVSPADAMITATSSAPGVATVTLSGNNLIINGLTAGSATINVTASKNGYQDTSMTFTVAVNAQPTVVLTNPGTQSVTVGQSITVALSLNPADATITATSDNSVATVTVSGNTLIIEGISPGTANINVTAQKAGCTDAQISFTVTVNNLAEQRVFSNWNGFGCVTGPTSPATFTLSQPLALTFMNTYHHNSPAEAPGTFSLVHSDGTVYGPWNASGGYSSLICYVNFKGGGDEGYQSALGPVTPSSQYPILKPGTYTMLDSNGATWSNNGDSGFAGFLQVKGYYRSIKPTDDISSSFTNANFKQAVWEWLGNTGTPGAFSKQNLINRMAAQNYNLNISNRSISSLAGLEYFVGTNLTGLNCSQNQLTALPALPTSLTGITCSNNQLTSLPALPTGLTYLECNGNYLSELPALPAGLNALFCGANRLIGLPSLPASLTNIFWCDMNYLDIWQGTIQTRVNGCPAGNKQISPQYKYIYAGSPAGFPAAGNTKQLVNSDLQRVQSTDGITWTDPVNGLISDFVFSTSNSSVATVSPGGTITAVGNGDCSIYANYKGLASNLTRVVIPVYVSGLNNAMIAHDDNSNNLVLLNVGSSLEYATNATDSSGASATWYAGTGSEVTITASGKYVMVRETLTPANTRCLGYINPALTNQLLRTDTAFVQTSCKNNFAYNGLSGQMDMSRLTGRGNMDLDERYAKVLVTNAASGTFASSGVVNPGGTVISSSADISSGETAMRSISGLLLAEGNDIGVTVHFYGLNGSSGSNSADDEWFLPSAAVTVKATTPDGGPEDYIDLSNPTSHKIRIATIQTNASVGDPIWCRDTGFARTANVLDGDKKLAIPGDIGGLLSANAYVSLATEDPTTGNVFIDVGYGIIPVAPTSVHVAASGGNAQDCINASNLTSVQVGAGFGSPQSGTVHFRLANSGSSKYVVSQTLYETNFTQLSGTVNAGAPNGGAFTNGETLILSAYLEEASGNRGPLLANNSIQFDTTTYTVTYNGNGHDGGIVPANGSYPAGSSTTVADDNAGTMTKTGCTFSGWNTAADWTGTDYPAGSPISTAGNTTLYAKWQLDAAPNGANLGFKYNNAQLEVTNAALPSYTTLEIFIKDSTPGEQGPGSNEAKYTLDLTDSANLSIDWHSVVGSSPPINASYCMWYRYINGTAKSIWVQDGYPNGYQPAKGGTQASDFVAVNSTSISFNNTNGIYNGYTLMAIRSGSWVSLGTIGGNNQTFTVVVGDQFVIKSPEGNYSYESAAYSYP